ncbi:hypothetical protein FN976_27305 [Caenimonas sedimenti]|uniref:Uncharacterized protein n=1 Tax=Caenimonas sedimenti TaxID=2596921 RepID=A0A562ZEG3_9BURK|nr:hypothetical protein [Caenimonas sedimenti]TWO65517.1 hypothetical protein FN976_27305 [Caenimonas sedimenti]
MPDDTTPHGGEAFHQPPERAVIPEPPPGRAAGPLPPVTGRPPLPLEAEIRAADLEDEEADPVIDSGPGIADDGDTGKPSVTQQPA